MPDEMKVWASHGDFVSAAPPGFAVAASSDNAPVAVMEAPERGYYALLFHPEVAHTDRGRELLRNFAFDVCGCTGDWTIASFIDEATSRINESATAAGVGWGGLDSTSPINHPPRDRRSPAGLFVGNACSASRSEEVSSAKRTAARCISHASERS